MLTDFWRDIIGMAGLALTLAGLLYAIRAKTAAVAAREAAEAAREESRRNYLSHVASMADRFLNEANSCIADAKWELATLRLGDLAFQLGQLDASNRAMGRHAAKVRKWAKQCNREKVRDEEFPRFDGNKWDADFRSILKALDKLRGPFAEGGTADDTP